MTKATGLSVQELYKLISSLSSMPACLEVIRFSFLHSDMYIFSHIVPLFKLKFCFLKKCFYHAMNFQFLNIMLWWLLISFYKQLVIQACFSWKYICHRYLQTFVITWLTDVVMKN